MQSKIILAKFLTLTADLNNTCIYFIGCLKNYFFTSKISLFLKTELIFDRKFSIN